MGKEIVTQLQETQRVPNRINPRRNTPRHILIKLMKIKDRDQILTASREKQQTTLKGMPIRIIADLAIETLQTRREWQDILKVMKEKKPTTKLLYPERISFKYEGEIKIFTDKQKLREFSTAKPALHFQTVCFPWFEVGLFLYPFSQSLSFHWGIRPIYI